MVTSASLMPAVLPWRGHVHQHSPVLDELLLTSFPLSAEHEMTLSVLIFEVHTDTQVCYINLNSVSNMVCTSFH